MLLVQPGQASEPRGVGQRARMRSRTRWSTSGGSRRARSRCADNRQVLADYSPDMKRLLKRGYRAKKRPSGHNITKKFHRARGGSIPSNVLESAATTRATPTTSSSAAEYGSEAAPRALPGRPAGVLHQVSHAPPATLSSIRSPAATRRAPWPKGSVVAGWRSSSSRSTR